MLDSKLLSIAADKVATLDDDALKAAHERSHEDTLIKSNDGLSAHHILSAELTKRGFGCNDHYPPLFVSANDVTKRAFEAVKENLPMDLVASLLEAFNTKAEMATVMTMLSSKGYDMQVIAREEGDERSGEEMFSELIYPGMSNPLDAPEDEEEGEDEEDEQESEESGSTLGRFLSSLAELLGVEKGYSFAVEDSVINRNKRRSEAKQEHAFKAGKYKTRDGRVRCLTCGGEMPVGKMCNKQPSAKIVFGKEAPATKADTFTPPQAGSGFTATGRAQFAKADERRFTLGPMYIPDREDAHGEWTDADELQQALWGYVRSGDRRIRLQHNREVVAGEWVEVMTFPFAMKVPMIQPDGTTQEIEYPANTVFMGIVWEPWAWQMVKDGKLRGLSIGGKAQRIDADIPMEEEIDKSDPSVSSVHIDVPIGAYPRKPKEKK